MVAQLAQCLMIVLFCATPASSFSINRLGSTKAPSISPGRSVGGKTTVWLDAFARSGSSVVYALIQHAGKQESGDVFEVYEPCHYKNELEPELLAKGCDGLMHQMLKCDFTGIKNLRFELPAGGEDACKQANMVLYKTVNLTTTIPLLDSMKASPKLARSVLSYAADSNIRIVELVRDPRGIYASWVSLREFRHNVIRAPSSLTEICDVFASNLRLKHANLHKVVFEELVRHPEHVTEQLMTFLGLPYSQGTKNWIKSHFESDCGYDDATVGGAYRLCQNDPESHIEKWRGILNQGEMNAFKTHPACRELAHEFNYTLDE